MNVDPRQVSLPSVHVQTDEVASLMNCSPKNAEISDTLTTGSSPAQEKTWLQNCWSALVRFWENLCAFFREKCCPKDAAPPQDLKPDLKPPLDKGSGVLVDEGSGVLGQPPEKEEENNEPFSLIPGTRVQIGKEIIVVQGPSEEPDASEKEEEFDLTSNASEESEEPPFPAKELRQARINGAITNLDMALNIHGRLTNNRLLQRLNPVWQYVPTSEKLKLAGLSSESDLSSFWNYGPIVVNLLQTNPEHPALLAGFRDIQAQNKRDLFANFREAEAPFQTLVAAVLEGADLEGLPLVPPAPPALSKEPEVIDDEFDAFISSLHSYSPPARFSQAPSKEQDFPRLALSVAAPLSKPGVTRQDRINTALLDMETQLNTIHSPYEIARGLPQTILGTRLYSVWANLTGAEKLEFSRCKNRGELDDFHGYFSVIRMLLLTDPNHRAVLDGFRTIAKGSHFGRLIPETAARAFDVLVAAVLEGANLDDLPPARVLQAPSKEQDLPRLALSVAAPLSKPGVTRQDRINTALGDLIAAFEAERGSNEPSMMAGGRMKSWEFTLRMRLIYVWNELGKDEQLRLSGCTESWHLEYRFIGELPIVLNLLRTDSTHPAVIAGFRSLHATRDLCFSNDPLIGNPFNRLVAAVLEG